MNSSIQHMEDVSKQASKDSDFTNRYIVITPDVTDELAMFSGFPAADQIAAQLVIGGCCYQPAARARVKGADWPQLWVQGDVCSGKHVWGAQAFVVPDKPLHRIVQNNRVIGSYWSDEEADYCLLAGILPATQTVTRGEQTYSCFEQAEAALAQANMDFSHVVRTWLYLDRLLDWYDEFNNARTRFFESRQVFDRLVPASTGIGAKNCAGAALAAGVLAIKPRTAQLHISAVVSPLQRSAIEYRSSFSRAVELDFNARRVLMISGTASIAPDGKSMYADDIRKQIHLSLDVVEAILKSRSMDWPHVVRAVGYFYDITQVPVFEECCQERGIAPLPLVPAHAIVCRHDLLFEIELDAVALNVGKTV